MEQIYDMLILGGGPAGYSAALYAVRAGLTALVLEKMAPGGQTTQTTQIDNYPGFDQGIDGWELGEKMRSGAERFGAQTQFAQILSAELTRKIKKVVTDSGAYLGKTVVIATGAGHRHLGLPQEDAYIGSGLAYCAACDGMFYRGKTVAVIGGGNSAAADALHLSRICKKVILIHRRDSLRADKIYHDQLKERENIEFRWNNTANALLGKGRLAGLQLRDVHTGSLSELPVEGVFISIGRSPVTGLFVEQVALDEEGYILADESTRTNLPGVFAAGDVRTKALRQVITAAADGAVAVHYAQKYLLDEK